MNKKKLFWRTILIVCLVGCVLCLGFVAWRYTRNFNDYILGGRSLGGVVTALSVGASDMSGWLLMGLPGAVFLSGITESWIAIGLTLGTYLNWKFVAARLRVYTEVSHNALTLPDFFTHRFKDDTRMLRMSRVRGSEQAPIVYFYSYFNPAIGMTGEEDFTQPLYTMLEQRYGVIVHKSVEEVSAMLADEELADKLGIRAGDPILKRKRLVLDASGFPVEFNVGYYRADSFTYRIEAEK